MSRQINIKLNQAELAVVEEAMHHSPQAEVRQRATAIRMLHLGNKPETVAELLAVASSTSWNWHRRYRAAGLAGLINQAKSSRPAKADVAYLDALACALAADREGHKGSEDRNFGKVAPGRMLQRQAFLHV